MDSFKLILRISTSLSNFHSLTTLFFLFMLSSQLLISNSIAFKAIKLVLSKTFISIRTSPIKLLCSRSGDNFISYLFGTIFFGSLNCFSLVLVFISTPSFEN